VGVDVAVGIGVIVTVGKTDCEEMREVVVSTGDGDERAGFDEVQPAVIIKTKINK